MKKGPERCLRETHIFILCLPFLDILRAGCKPYDKNSAFARTAGLIQGAVSRRRFRWRQRVVNR
jgi:hypothetical protein